MYPSFSLNLLIQKLHPFALQSYQFLGLINISPMYSKTKQDIKNLRYSVVVKHVRSNHANFQRFWPRDKGTESFEIRPPPVHSNFSLESKNQLHNKICKARKIWHPRVSALNICHLYMFHMYIPKSGGSPLYFNTFN